MDGPGSAAALRAHETDVASCTRCALAETRARVVVGTGPADARVLVVGEAPGFREEHGDGPFSGEGGALLVELLGRVGLAPADVYVTTVLKCRPPANRDPAPDELAACEPHLFRQLELVRPEVVVSLGTVATRLLSGRPHAITTVHGCPQELSLGGRATTLLPLYDPSVALYTPRMRATLEQDVAVLAELLGRPAGAVRAVSPSVPTAVAPAAPLPVAVAGASPASSPAVGVATEGPAQLDLF